MPRLYSGGWVGAGGTPALHNAAEWSAGVPPATPRQGRKNLGGGNAPVVRDGENHRPAGA